MNLRRVGLSLIPSVVCLLFAIPWGAVFCLLVVNDIQYSFLSLLVAFLFMFYGLFCTLGELSEISKRITMHYVIETVSLYENLILAMTTISLMSGVIFFHSYDFMLGVSIVFFMSAILDIIVLYSVRIIVNISIMFECKRRKELATKKVNLIGKCKNVIKA